jgi:cytochrome P450
MAVSQGHRLPSLFSTTDEAYHANLRRSVNSAFSMSALVQYEPLVDEVAKVFLDQTQSLFAAPSKTCNFAEWLQFFAFDVIGQITYSRRHGFIDRAADVEGVVTYPGKLFSYVAPVGQIPWLDHLFLKNPIILLLDRLGVKLFSFPITVFAKANMQERMQEIASSKADGVDKVGNRRGDLLEMFLKAQADRPDFMTHDRVLVMAVSMAFAGSETTAISLAAVFYYLLKNPRCYHNVLQELDAAVKDGIIENRNDGLVTWAESQRLPYLDACIKEAFRLHPAAGLPLERIVPPQGIEICGERIAGGMIVGCSAWVIHRRKELFGDDVDYYRPERWLEADKDQLKEMNAAMFQFGAGSRTCIGKNISLLEVYKLVPSFLRRFKASRAATFSPLILTSSQVELANPEKEWKLHNAWFVKQFDFDTTFAAKSIS